MSRLIVVLRPEPGNRATVTRLDAAGLTAIALPLFEIRPVDWTPPALDRYDALLLTSANAVWFGGEGLAALRALPVLAVGAATAEAARHAGFEVRLVGRQGVAALLDAPAAKRYQHLLHLGGRDRIAPPTGAVTTAIVVYASEPTSLAADRVRVIEQAVALIHSARAASQLGVIADRAGIDRRTVRVAVLSDAVAAAAGPGWAQIATAAIATDSALIALAARLAD